MLRPTALAALLALVAANCKDDSGKNLRKGSVIKDDAYIYTCVEDPGFAGDFFLKTTGCVMDGLELGLGGRSENGYYVYECSNKGGSVAIVAVACKGPAGQVVKEGGIITRGEYAFECGADEWGNLRLQPYGCIDEGRAVEVGRAFNGDRGFWYNCEIRNGQPMKVIQGCVTEDGKRVNNGDVLIVDTFAAICMCTTRGCTNRVSGCAEEKENGEKAARALGEYWLQGRAPFRYRVHCKTCSLGITIVRTATQCRSEGGMFLNPGCMRREGRMLLACGINSSSTLQLYSSPYSAAAVADYRAQKYRMC